MRNQPRREIKEGFSREFHDDMESIKVKLSMKIPLSQEEIAIGAVSSSRDPWKTLIEVERGYVFKMISEERKK